MTDLVARMGATSPAVASPSERTIEGLAVPFGATGISEFGALTFAAGAITFGAVGHVKLLFQHDPKISLGYATELTETDQGLYARFAVAEGPEGDKALTEAANGARDGLSVGVMLDDASIDEVMRKMIENDRTPTAAAGRLLEVSQVSLPAFDDARIPSAAASSAAPVTFSIHVQPQEEPPMTTTTAPAEVISAPAEVDPAPTPTPSPFEAGFQTVAEAPVYTFDGRGPSFVRDMWRSRFEGDSDAGDRLARFNHRWLEREPLQMQQFLRAAVETRPNVFTPTPYRPDMLVEAIDKGRPLTSRIGTVGLTDATPFRLPVEGEMTAGVGDHTEGTAHVAEGDSAVSDVTVTPGAISGAFRLSRELIDSTNPAIDQVALRQMMRLYRNATEAKVVAALDAADSTATASINTVIELRAQIDAYYNTLFEDPTAIAASPAYYGTLLSDVDSTGRPHLASQGPMNAVGTGQAGGTGASIDGVEIFKAWGVTTAMAYLFRAEDVFIGESSVSTFRFEEVEGPGVVKLALWSYFAAKVTRPASVVKVGSA